MLQPLVLLILLVFFVGRANGNPEQTIQVDTHNSPAFCHVSSLGGAGAVLIPEINMAASTQAAPPNMRGVS